MAGRRLQLGCAYAVEGLTSLSACMVMNNIAFFTAQRFGWNAGQNLLLMMVQGALYTGGSLAAGRFVERMSKPRLLMLISAALLAIVLSLQFSASAALLIPLMLLFVPVCALTWPVLESLVTQGCEPSRMARQITIYNMIWSSVNVASTAVYGTILYYWPAGPLIIPIYCHVLALAAAAILRRNYRPPATSPMEHAHDHHAGIELAHSRRLALWLARISLPASFVISNSLMGLFPSLPISREIGIAMATLLASLWMAGRMAAFLVLGLTDWWHSRPRILLWAGLLMFLAFLAIAIPAERVGPFATMPVPWIIATIALAEVVLGVTAGIVFAGSLYFGMVLSDGSTDHGGYHEALIGVGMVLGPGLAAGAQFMAADGGRWPAVAAVSGLMVLTLSAAGIVSVRMRPRARVKILSRLPVP